MRELPKGAVSGQLLEPSRGGSILSEGFRAEISERVILHGITDLNGIAADFAVFDISLASYREIEDH